MTRTNPRFTDLLRRPDVLLAFGFGSGLAPKAPGTVGTLAAVPVYLLLRELPQVYYAAAVIISFVVGCWFCAQASRYLQVHDHGGIVWDEFVGLWITMWFAPPQWWWIVIGFVLFRLFDILKPWPIRMADRKVGGGFGIMFDDVLAAIYALVCLQVLAWLIVDYRAF